MEQGAAVRITIKAGAVARNTAYSATRFVGTVYPGQQGLYIGPLAGKLRAEGWHLVSVGDWDVPLHRSQFEEA